MWSTSNRPGLSHALHRYPSLSKTASLTAFQRPRCSLANGLDNDVLRLSILDRRTTPTPERDREDARRYSVILCPLTSSPSAPLHRRRLPVGSLMVRASDMPERRSKLLTGVSFPSIAAPTKALTSSLPSFHPILRVTSWVKGNPTASRCCRNSASRHASGNNRSRSTPPFQGSIQ